MSLADEIQTMARRLDNNDIGVVEACRHLARHLAQSRWRDDPDALVIFGVDSETDDLPIGEARQLWDRLAVAEFDKQRTEYEDRVRGEVTAACKALGLKVSTHEQMSGST